MRKTVYLAGPITGTSYEEATNGWRKEIAAQLDEEGISCLSPMRGCEHLKGTSKFTSLEKDYGVNPVTTAAAIVARDRNDVRTCDLMIVNFLGATQRSLGTAVEFGWADRYDKPIILIMEDEGNVHEHVMLTHLAGFRVRTLEDAVLLAEHILLPGT
jgi:nucleoside 2-deoxyribosyltransferase